MRRYGWPLVLFVVIPFAAIIGRTFGAYFFDMTTSGNGDSSDVNLWMSGGSSLTRVVLLGVLYPWVRKAEQALLRLVWSCALTIAGIATLVNFGTLLVGTEDPFWPLLSPRVYLLHSLIFILPPLWFARQASRASLAHAFFVVFIIGGPSLPNLPESLPFYFEWLWGFAGDLLAVWLLANFETYGLWFRRSATVALVVLEWLVYLPLLWLPLFLPIQTAVLLILFPLQLFLIYILRVRRPAAEAGLMSGIPTSSPCDER